MCVCVCVCECVMCAGTHTQVHKIYTDKKKTFESPFI